MAGRRTHVEVRFPSFGTVLGSYTTADPRCTVDAMLETTRMQDGEARFVTSTLVRGLSPAQHDEILARLGERYESPPEVLERFPDGLLLRTVLDPAGMPPALRVLARFQVEFHAHWSHIEGGTYAMRARVPFGGDVEGLMADMKEGLEKAGVPADVEAIRLEDVDLQGLRALEAAVKRALPGRERVAVAF